MPERDMHAETDADIVYNLLIGLWRGLPTPRDREIMHQTKRYVLEMERHPEGTWEDAIISPSPEHCAAAKLADFIHQCMKMDMQREQQQAQDRGEEQEQEQEMGR